MATFICYTQKGWDWQHIHRNGTYHYNSPTEKKRGKKTNLFIWTAGQLNLYLSTFTEATETAETMILTVGMDCLCLGSNAFMLLHKKW